MRDIEPRTHPDLVARAAAQLAAAAHPVAALPGVLDDLRGATGASSCILWRTTEDGDIPMATSRAAAGATVLRIAIDGARFPIAAAGRPLGALELLGVSAASCAVDLRVICDILAPVLIAAEDGERLAAEIARRGRETEEQRRFIEKIVDSLPVGLYVIDRAYRIQAWNRKRETGMLGVSREEAIGRPIFEILHRQPEQRLREEFDDVFATGSIRQYQMESAALGEPRTYRVTKIPMSLDGVQVSHVITIGEDVTAWKGAQQRMAQSETLAAVGQLAAGVMHEINNPLATIGACGESMTLRLDEPDVAGWMRDAFADYLRIVDHEVHRCKRIIDGLLDFSRPKEPVLSPTDVNLVLDETLFLLKHHAAFRRMRVETHFDPTLPLLSGNSERLIQVFMALLLNACDASTGTGAIEITTSRDAAPPDSIVITVRDDGHGIPRAELTKIFEPFYTTKAPGRGTGLGLSICYGIIADHGGRIDVDSTPPTGTTFRIVLPVGDAPASPGEQRA